MACTSDAAGAGNSPGTGCGPLLAGTAGMDASLFSFPKDTLSAGNPRHPPGEFGGFFIRIFFTICEFDIKPISLLNYDEQR